MDELLVTGRPSSELAAPHFVGVDASGYVHPLARVGGEPEDRDWPGGPGFSPVVDRSARISAFCTVDAGTRRATSIGARSWLLQHAHVGHDAQVGQDVTIGNHAVVCGFARIEDDARIEVGALIQPYRHVGRGARIGTGAIVTRDVPPGETWVGNPARKLEDHERDPRPHTERREGSPPPPPPPPPGRTFTGGRAR